ncbi:MAG: CopG family ribbon-helix-helix protein [Terriglobales bacterium]
MSDIMSTQRITVRVSESLVKRLKRQAGMKRRSESAVVREALENYLGETPASDSAYDLAKAAGLIGCVRGGPTDLSVNRKHLQGFGEGHSR